MMKNRKNGFTLAEALITLAVIGVVAAIALPALFEAWDNQKQEAARKKAMYTVASGYKKMATDNEVSMNNLPLFKCGSKFACLSEWHRKTFSIASDQTKSHEGLPESYVRSDSDEEEAGFSWDLVPYIFTTADGMTFGYISGTKSGGIEVAVDMNGIGEPNKICEDVFKIVIDNNGGATETYKDGETTKSLCSKLNDPPVPCTADYAKNKKICEPKVGLANLHSNAYDAYSEGPRIYVNGEALFDARITCTSDGKPIAIYEADRGSDDMAIYDVIDLDASYAEYCP